MRENGCVFASGLKSHHFQRTSSPTARLRGGLPGERVVGGDFQGRNTERTESEVPLKSRVHGELCAMDAWGEQKGGEQEPPTATGHNLPPL